MKAILAIDQGTSASKAAVFDQAGRILGVSRVALSTRYGPAGRAEQDPDDILDTQRRAIRRAVTGAGGRRIILLAAGLASQRSTFVLWERRTGRPIGPAPTWQSIEDGGVCDRLARHGGSVRRRTGLPLSPHYSAPKLARLLRESPRLRRRAERGDVLFGNVATWLLWNLTSGRVHATDPTHAARTLLFNIRTLRWDPKLLALFGVPRAMLPQVRHSLGDFGLASLGGRSVPVRALLGDQQAALLGVAGVSGSGPATSALVNYGTGAFVLVPTGGVPRTRRGLLTSLAYTSRRERCYLIEGTVNAAGALVDWLHRELRAPSDLARLDRLCRRAPPGGLMVPSFWGIGSLHAGTGRATPPALLLGIEPVSTTAAVARAGVEAIAHMVEEILSRGLAGAAARRRPMIVTGGLAGLRYLVEFQSALAGRPVLVPSRREATLWGAAAAAAHGWPGAGAIRPRTLESHAAGSRSARSRGEVWRDARVVKAPASRIRSARRRHGRWLRLVDMARRWEEKERS